ncbi:hypothetical protein H4W00_001766 [Psychrobacter sp. PL19]|uniref:DUF1176 domain-containing protein n=1 Tax=Psychrobacter sp. PL19 TaxID=2760711 RepID=UPI001AE417AC
MIRKNDYNKLVKVPLLTNDNNADHYNHVDSCFDLNSTLKSIFKNKLLLPIFTAMGMSLISPMSIAAAPVAFNYQDWQVVCDNTRTCRLAGYQAENDSEFPVSILLTRRAGVNASVDGKVKLGGAKENSSKALMQLGNRHRISLFINDKDLGETKPFSAAAGDADLTTSQVAALLEALTKSSKIELVLRNSRWQLSDKGATAVMLKADEAQGRVGTASAFVNNESGRKSNNGILASEPAPSLRLVIPDTKAISSSNKSFSMKSSQLSTLMQDTMKDASSDCPNLFDKSPWRVSRLNNTQLLAQHSCWTGAYNTGTGVWLLNDSKPHKPTLVTSSATDYSNGKISSVQKGRGIGDCVSRTDWLWTGNRFVKSHESTTGLCRLIEAGGAWQMPTYVSEVTTSR